MKTRNMVLIALFAALLAICAWISIPMGDVAFTLQTFGVCLSLLLLGGKRGTIAILVYLLLGAVGLPVFSGFRGGLGALFGVTGGYMLGFLATGLIFLLTTACKGAPLLGLIFGLAACYLIGSVWYWGLYLRSGESLGFGLILLKCVLPYLLPDTVKLMLALFLARRLKPFVY